MNSSDHLMFFQPPKKLNTKGEVCIVGREAAITNPLKRALKVAGFNAISVMSSLDPLATRRKLDEASIVLVFLDDNEEEVRSYLQSAKHQQTAPPVIIVTESMDVDGLFEYLSMGAKAFLVLPFSVSSVEEVLSYAQHAPDLDTELLTFENRNKAFSQCVLNNLERTSRAVRKCMDKMISQREMNYYIGAFRHSARLARSFRVNSDEALREEIVNTILERAERYNTRLQRARRALASERTVSKSD